MLFIIWDPRDRHDGLPRFDDSGKIISDGILGRIGPDNVYLTAYANYHKDERRPGDLEVGEHIDGVGFRLSGEHGRYDVWRVA